MPFSKVSPWTLQPSCAALMEIVNLIAGLPMVTGEIDGLRVVEMTGQSPQRVERARFCNLRLGLQPLDVLCAER